MADKINYLFILFMPYANYGRPLSVMKASHTPQQAEGEARLN